MIRARFSCPLRVLLFDWEIEKFDEEINLENGINSTGKLCHFYYKATVGPHESDRKMCFLHVWSRFVVGFEKIVWRWSFVNVIRIFPKSFGTFFTLALSTVWAFVCLFICVRVCVLLHVCTDLWTCTHTHKHTRPNHNEKTGALTTSSEIRKQKNTVQKAQTSSLFVGMSANPNTNKFPRQRKVECMFMRTWMGFECLMSVYGYVYTNK